MKGRIRKRMVISLLSLILILGSCHMFLEYKQRILEQPVNSNMDSGELLIPGGMPVGIYMETKGVLVLGLQEIECNDGSRSIPGRHLIKDGDYIVGLDAERINNKKELSEKVKKIKSDTTVVKIRRKNEEIQVKIHPVKDKKENTKLGIWVRDNVQGLGTVTYLKTDSSFGALGHGLHDSDTGTLMEISDGKVYDTYIQDIKKGEIGKTGGMEGIIVYNNQNVLGTIEKNTEQGIFGRIDKTERVFKEKKAIPAAKREEVRTGGAVIRCTIDGQTEDYKIKIVKTDHDSGEKNRGMELKITDENLLKKTGGVIQGMSGSPIIQDGKIVGAVTHVLVNDPTRGYGIFIENMLEAENDKIPKCS